ncbi:MAG: ABC transporter permease [Bdellovibrio sp.]|nr:MAG: ABC transporter permease [Bdellovibrio sp.]
MFLLLIVFIKWKLNWKELIYSSSRMLVQLLLIGYLLNAIFSQESLFWTSLILIVMLISSSWISLQVIKKYRKKFFFKALAALFLGSLPILFLTVIFVIPSNGHWYQPSFLIPLAGMVFSNSMNTLSLSAERFFREKNNNENEMTEAKKTALSTSLIPQMNRFLAVGLVALPGIMTGQILSGVDPLLAVRYQIVIMTMIMGASGLSAAIFLEWMTQNPPTVN